MNCEECGMPLDHSDDQIGLPPVKMDDKEFCGVQCLHEFVERITRHSIDRIPAVNLQEALRMRQTMG